MSFPLDSAFDFAKGVMDRIWPEKASEDDKIKAAQELVPMLQQREKAVVDAQKSVMMAELEQGDKYTKRARPSIVYGGLAIIFLNWLVEASLKVFNSFRVADLNPDQIETLLEITKIELPSQFWAAWAGVVGIYAIGRSAEKRGASNKVLSMITGSK